jgi:type III pantothenate kinase
MGKSLLVIDIGNTNIVVGAFAGEALLFEFRFKTDAARTIDEYDAALTPLLERKLGPAPQFVGCVISSVVPPMTPTFIRLVKDQYRLEPVVIGPGIKTGMPIKLPDPSAVGADRIVNAVAAKNIYGTPALVIDFGTATSFDYVDKDGSYQGGIISPGPTVALESLVRNTAKLPRIELAWPKQVIGNGTVAAMQSGTVLGYSCMVEGLIAKVQEEVGPIQHIIATGGLGRLFSEHSKQIHSYDPHLTLKGMLIIARLNSIAI